VREEVEEGLEGVWSEICHPVEREGELWQRGRGRLQDQGAGPTVGEEAVVVNLIIA